MLFFSFLAWLAAGQAQIIFNKTIDLSGQYEICAGIAPKAGGYYFVQQNIWNTYEDTYLSIAAMDEQGEVLWHKAYCRDSSLCACTNSSLSYTHEGDLVVYGSYKKHPTADWEAMWFEFSPEGDSIVLHTYGGGELKAFHHMQPVPGDGYIAAGVTSEYDLSGDIYLVRLNADKSVRWERHYSFPSTQIGHSVGLLPDGGFAVVGKGGHFGAATIIAMRTDSLGELLWQQELGGSGDNDGRHNVSVLSDGSLLVSASTSPNGNLRRGYLAKLTLEGEIIWERNYSAGSFTLLTVPAIEVEDGSFVVSGGRNVYVPSIGRQAYHARILKLAANGDVIWERIYHGRPDVSNYLYGLHRTSDGGFIGHGSSYGPDNATLQDGWILKMDSEGISCPELGCLLVHLEAPAPGRASLSCAPNPAQGWAYVDYLLPQAVEGLEASVWDLAGRRVFYRREPARADSGSLALDVSDWPPGMYVVRLQAGGQVLGVEKLVVY
jgi:outer membrane protein assembly factor BamB